MIITNKIINKAIGEALKSNVKRAKIGAVLFTHRGRILSSAHNSTLYGYGDKWTIHAEIFLLAKMNNLKILSRHNTNKLNILVLRVKHDKSLSMAKPCDVCQKALNPLDITVYYSDYKGDIKELSYD